MKIIDNRLKTVHLTGDFGTGSGSSSRATGDVPQDVKVFSPPNQEGFLFYKFFKCH